MKRTLIAIIAAPVAASSALALSGCGGSSGSKSESKASDTSLSASSKAESTKEEDKAVISEEDVVFNHNGVSIKLNTPMEDVIGELGEVEPKSEKSCHGEGEDKTYTYEGFNVYTYPLDGKDMILQVAVTDAGIATSKGIEVGSSVDDVTAAYGSEFKKVGVYYSYSAGEGKTLRFRIKDNAVTQIDYYYNV